MSENLLPLLYYERTTHENSLHFQDPKKSQSDFWETGNPKDFPVHRKFRLITPCSSHRNQGFLGHQKRKAFLRAMRLHNRNFPAFQTGTNGFEKSLAFRNIFKKAQIV